MRPPPAHLCPRRHWPRCDVNPKQQRDAVVPLFRFGVLTIAQPYAWAAPVLLDERASDAPVSCFAHQTDVLMEMPMLFDMPVLNGGYLEYVGVQRTEKLADDALAPAVCRDSFERVHCAAKNGFVLIKA
jgi:hypothetical protein